MDLNLARLVIDLDPESVHGITPLISGKGAVFEELLRTLCCSRQNRTCHACPTARDCITSSLLARQLSPDPELVRRHQKPGLPFVFELISKDGQGAGRLGLTLLGEARGHLSVFLQAINLLTGQKNCCELSALDYQDVPMVLNQFNPDAADNLPVLATADLLALYSHSFSCCKRLRLVLLTPLRLIRDGRELNDLDPVFFIRSLLRRMSALAAYYGGGVDQEQFRALSALAESVTLIRTHDNQKAEVVSQRGVTGSFELAGSFDELGPFLALGSLFHLGKGASFGKGNFVVTDFN